MNVNNVEGICVILNFAFYVIGMVGVWNMTHNWWALFFTTVAAIHVKITNQKA